MLELKKSLEALRDMVATRMQMLRTGVTYYTEDQKTFYLEEYLSKLLELDRLILALSTALANPNRNQAD